MDKTYWEILGTWFFGISNIVVSVVAVWLGNRRLKPNLFGSSAYYGQSISEYDSSEVLVFNLVNRNPYSIRISSITLIFHKKKDKLAIFPHGDQLPTIIESGMNKLIDVNLERFSDNFPKGQEISAKGIKKMKVEVGTSLGFVLINPEHNFKQEISRIILEKSRDFGDQNAKD